MRRTTNIYHHLPNKMMWQRIRRSQDGQASNCIVSLYVLAMKLLRAHTVTNMMTTIEANSLRRFWVYIYRSQKIPAPALLQQHPSTSHQERAHPFPTYLDSIILNPRQAAFGSLTGTKCANDASSKFTKLRKCGDLASLKSISQCRLLLLGP